GSRIVPIYLSRPRTHEGARTSWQRALGRLTESPLPLGERDRVRGLARKREDHKRRDANAAARTRATCNGFIGACRRQTPHPVPLPQGERGLCKTILRWIAQPTAVKR